MTTEQINILLKSWEMTQAMVKSLEENFWKIRSVYVGFWSILIAYAYQRQEPILLLGSVVILFPFFMFEGGLKLIQLKYISNSISLEATLNDILIGEEVPRLPERGISTNFGLIRPKEFLKLFQLKRWLFWAPYLFLILLTALTYYYLRIAYCV